MHFKSRFRVASVVLSRLTQRTQSRRTKRRARRLLLEPLEDRRLLAVDWRNPTNPLDVSNDGLISPIDPLQVINELNRAGSDDTLFAGRANKGTFYFYSVPCFCKISYGRWVYGDDQSNGPSVQRGLAPSRDVGTRGMTFMGLGASPL